MIAIVQFNIVVLAVAMSIGVVTGWLMFRRRSAAQKLPQDNDAA